MVLLSQSLKWNRVALTMGLAALFLLAIWGGLKNLPDLVGRLESTLTDMRLRMRAERFAPSPDIVVVAFDQGSKEYFEKHAELGITGSALPRNKLAGVIDALAKEGAVSIILDVELKAPSANPEHDRLLGEAIRRAGNVSAASYMDDTLRQFVDEAAHGINTPLYANVTLMSAYVQPYLNRSVFQCRYLPVSCALSFIGLNSQAIYPLGSQSLRLPENLSETWQAMAVIDFWAAHGYGTGLKQPARLLASQASSLEEAYARLCLEDRYRQLYRNRPVFLSSLAQQPEEKLVFGVQPSLEAEQDFSYCRMSPVIEPVSAAVRQIGVSTVNYGNKTLLRQIPVFYKGFQGRYFYYLPFLPALQRWNHPDLKITKEGFEIAGRKRIDFFENGQVLINWRNPRHLAEKIYGDFGIPLERLTDEHQSVRSDKPNQVLGYGHLYRVVSVADVLKRLQKPLDRTMPTLFNLYGKPASGEFDFKGKIVIYGDAVKDIHITPIGDIIYGPEILANVTDMVLHDQNFVRPAPPAAVLAFTLVLLGLVVYPVLVWPRFSVGILIALGGLGLFVACNILMFVRSGLCFPIVWPTALGLLCLLAVMVYRYSVQDQEKRQLTSIFSKYVSPQVMREILSDTDSALEKLKGQKKELTVLFVDIHNFTERLDNAEPEKMVAQLNEYFNAMIQVVMSCGGTYDKYMGDALMVFFGAPMDDPAHAEKACQAALAMHEALAGLNRKWAESGLPVLKHGIGLASGPMLVGNLGSDTIKNFTVMGAVVNLGSRLEALTRQLQADTLVNARTRELVLGNPAFSFDDMGQLDIKGFSGSVQVYSLHPST